MSSTKNQVLVNLQQAVALLVEHRNSGSKQIFGAKYVKKDGTLRTATGRFHITKGVTGVGLKYNPEERKLIGYYDMGVALDASQAKDLDEKSFRMLNTETLKELTLEGVKYVVQE
jgi:hypothetical protein